MMPDTIVHYLPTTDGHTGPSQTASLVYILIMMFHAMEYPFGQLRSAVLAVLPPSSCVPSGWQTMGTESS